MQTVEDEGSVGCGYGSSEAPARASSGEYSVSDFPETSDFGSPNLSVDSFRSQLDRSLGERGEEEGFPYGEEDWIHPPYGVDAVEASDAGMKKQSLASAVRIPLGNQGDLRGEGEDGAGLLVGSCPY